MATVSGAAALLLAHYSFRNTMPFYTQNGYFKVINEQKEVLLPQNFLYRFLLIIALFSIQSWCSSKPENCEIFTSVSRPFQGTFLIFLKDRAGWQFIYLSKLD